MGTHHAFLLLRFEGPLQSWGIRSRWDVRDSADEPTKSAVMGMLGAALGYPMYDPRLEKLDEELMMAVRVEHPGTPMVDFHTISGRMQTASGAWRGSTEAPSTIISPRTYLQDAAFLVALQGEIALMSRCAEALQAPFWPVFLGRKACIPTRPVFDALSEVYVSLRDVMEQRPWRWDAQQHVARPLPEKLKCIIEDPGGSSTRYDRIRVNPARMYAWRRVDVDLVDFPGVDDGQTGGVM